ncbi:dUTP diphosphatase [Pigmentibacter sp. JX0631]|uniref:dUTP diphosphatase n=1 Tax=Pigmentibacter sp. JX0631 TaxID=2976982 RepID=UPI002469B61D|nr:dUTP diphosphatase [Pigmentibacter sp. JX0631]WGL58929.1 dUTP diphosphatase [Pigmentibacter sp. JX0631]
MLKLEHSGVGEIFYATSQSAGFDICANENHIIPSGEWKLIKTGLRIIESISEQKMKVGQLEYQVIPEIQIRPRSGLALKHGITVLNSPSTIDADYRGEIMVTLINHSKSDFSIQVGDRIAQGVCALVLQLPGIHIKKVERGTGGFGSSGKN